LGGGEKKKKRGKGGLNIPCAGRDDNCVMEEGREKKEVLKGAVSVLGGDKKKKKRKGRNESNKGGRDLRILGLKPF